MTLTLFSFLLLTAVTPVGEREADRSRIQRHLAAVEADLRAVDVGHLAPALQQARRQNLDRLHAYRLAGIFPRNSDHPGELVPYFIDDDGVLCAVGHLVAESGFTEVASDIRDSENNARLLAMTHPALPAWIAASGLTADECARIQPTYCRCDTNYDPVCGVDGVTYENACFATDCAGVEVAYKGVCKGEDTTTGWPTPGTDGTGDATGSTAAPETTGTDPDTTGAPHPETTATTGSAPATTSETTDGDPPLTTSATDAPPATTGDSTGTTAAPETTEDKPKGCDCNTRDGHTGALLLALLALLPRRRTRP